MDNSLSSFEEWLQQIIIKLDQELEQLAQIDERLRSHLTHSTHSPSSTDEDTINQLLSEVRSKAQTLHFYRDLNFFSKRSLSTKNQERVLSRQAIRELLLQHDAQVKSDPWQSLQLNLQPPGIVERQGISLGITNLELSSQSIRLTFSLKGTIPLELVNEQETTPGSTHEGADPLPVLAGIQLVDDRGTVYHAEPPPFFQLPRGKREQWQVNSYMTFSGAVSQELQALYLTIQSFLLLPTQVFLILDKEPLIIQGSWSFTFLRGQR